MSTTMTPPKSTPNKAETRGGSRAKLVAGVVILILVVLAILFATLRPFSPAPLPSEGPDGVPSGAAGEVPGPVPGEPVGDGQRAPAMDELVTTQEDYWSGACADGRTPILTVHNDLQSPGVFTILDGTDFNDSVNFTIEVDVGRTHGVVTHTRDPVVPLGTPVELKLDTAGTLYLVFGAIKTITLQRQGMDTVGLC